MLRPPVSSIEALARLLSINDSRRPFDIFTPRSVNFGVLLDYSQVWLPLAYQVGDLVNTVPLAPGETRKFAKKTTIKRERKEKELDASLRVIGDESSQAGRVEAEVVKKAMQQSRFSAHANARGSVGVFSVSGGTKASEDASKDVSDTKKDMREAVSKASQQFKQERKLEVETSDQAVLEESSSGEIRNPNDEIPVTYLFYELQRRHLVSEHLTGIQPVVLVAAPVPVPSEVNESFLIRHDWILRRVLLDDSFAPAFELLRDTQVARQVEVGVRKEAVDEQLSALAETKEQLYVATRLRDRALGEIDEAVDLLMASAVGSGASDALATVLTGGLAGLFGSGSGLAEGVQEAFELKEEAAQEALARIDREMNRLRNRIEASTSALAQAIDAYASAVRAALRHEQEVLRLRLHITENILHYMQAIWEYEVLDQRYFSLHDIQVPLVEGKWSKDGMTVHIPDAETRVDLASIADLDNLLGFKGNYLMFPMKVDNAITTHLAMPYAFEVLDPRIIARLFVKANELARSVEDMLSSDLKGDSILDRLVQDLQVVNVPSGHLHIEALPGSRPVLEDFKLKHRYVDVLDALADVVVKEVEGLRRLLLLLAGDLRDPDVEYTRLHLSSARESPEGGFGAAKSAPVERRADEGPDGNG